MGNKTKCKEYRKPKAQKACKNRKMGKAKCYETALPSKSAKCAFAPGKATGNKPGKGGKPGKQSKTGTEGKIIIVVGIIIVIMIIFFIYSLIKGAGFLKANPEIMEAAAG